MRGVRSVSDPAGNNAPFMRALEAEADEGWGGLEDPVSPGEKHRVVHRFSAHSPPHADPAHSALFWRTV